MATSDSLLSFRLTVIFWNSCPTIVCHRNALWTRDQFGHTHAPFTHRPVYILTWVATWGVCWNPNPVDSYFGPVWGSALSPPRGGVRSPCNSGGRPWHRPPHPVYTRCASHSCMKEGWRAFHPNNRDAPAHLCIDLLKPHHTWGEISEICQNSGQITTNNDLYKPFGIDRTYLGWWWHPWWSRHVSCVWIQFYISVLEQKRKILNC